MSGPFKLKYSNSAFPFKSPLKDGDHSMKRDKDGNIIGYYADSEHFMRHNREEMQEEILKKGEGPTKEPVGPTEK